VVYEGVNVGYRPLNAGEAADTAAGHGLPAGYILFLGSVEKRKNVHGLLQAYARLRQMGEQRPLVIVGLRRSSAAIEQPLRELDLHPHVIFTGYLPDQDLPAIYSAADLFVFPSLYEGFGLPPLEAMACGTPVVCSHAGSLPEVVGDAAITVDPHDIEGLAEAMRRVLDDQVLRQELREKGLARARLFSWEKAARQTIEVYQQVLNGAPTPAHVPEER
jgi:glycosyltransferase involved in cell wall biosynthesis